jgi:hypothetical protein
MPLPAVSRARSDLPAPARAALDIAGLLTGLAFAAASLVRGAKIVHPAGVVHAARVRLYGRTAPDERSLAFLGQAGEHDAIVRFSRSLGLPEPLPDLLGLTLRLIDVHGPGLHQDFMLVSSVDAPVAHHLFVPSGDVQQRPYSSSLPYRAGDNRFLVGALPREDGVFDLAVSAINGRFEPIGEIRVGDRLPHELDATAFNPWNTGGGVAPAGWLNRLRAYAYPGSQAGWRARV